jgi:hypothetical protein
MAVEENAECILLPLPNLFQKQFVRNLRNPDYSRCGVDRQITRGLGLIEEFRRDFRRTMA